MRRTLAIGALLVGLGLCAAACSSGSNASSTTSSGSATSSTSPDSGTSSTTSAKTTLPEAGATTYLQLVAPVDTARIAFIGTRTHLAEEVAAGPFAAALTTWKRTLESYSWPTAATPAIQKLESDIPPLAASLENIATANWSEVNETTFTYQGSAVTSDTNAARKALGLPPA
jgi:hypothetical protein